jgi:hypothetical protein
MDLTPHWTQIQGDSRDVHTALQWVAEEIFQTGELTIPASHESKNDIEQALSRNFLIETDGQITFSNSDVRYEYLARHSANLLFQAWEKLEEFSEIFNQTCRYGFKFDHSREICETVLLILSQEQVKDIIGRISEVANQGVEGQRNGLFWNLFHPFCKVLHNLEFEPKSLADALENVIRATGADYAGGQLYPAIENLAARSRLDADILYHEFLERSDSLVINLTISVLLGLAQSSLQEAHHHAMDLVKSDVLIYRRIGISALGHFQYADSDEHRILLNDTLDKLENFREMPNPDINDIMVQAYGNLVEKSEEAKKRVIELALSNDLATKNQIAHILFLKAREAFDNPWYREAVFNLIQHPIPSLGAVEQLDSCIRYYVGNEPDTALDIIEALVINWDYSSTEEGKELPNILDGTLLELYNSHQNILFKRITHWFASNNQRLHRAAWKVQSYFSEIPSTESSDESTKEPIRRKIEFDSRIILSKQILDELQDQEVVHVIYRVAGYVVDAYSLASLLLSVLKREPNSSEINTLVVGLLANYVLYNYPGDGGDFIKYFLSLEDISDIEREVAQAALQHSDSYFEARQNLPRLKEFKPPSQRVYLLRLAEWKQQALIIDEARKRSVFSLMTTNIPLKYGRSFSIEREGDFTEPSQLSTFHYEQERPQGELIDPVGQIGQRLRWRNIGLRDF